MLVLPDIRQATDYDCGTACIDTVLRYYGVRTTAAVAQLANPVQGTSPDTIEALLRSAGLPVIAGNMTLDDLGWFTKSGRPVICAVTMEECGHWVVVRGVFRGKVYYHCPEDGDSRMVFLDFMDCWRDFTKTGQQFDHWGIVT